MIRTEEDANNRAVLEHWRNLSPSEVIQQIEISIANYLREVQKNDDSPRRDSNPRPKVFALQFNYNNKEDRRFTKPSLCQAELLGQNKCKFSSSLFNASR
jgi:hypothetical protein